MAGDSSHTKWWERFRPSGRHSARSQTQDGSQHGSIAASVTSLQSNVVLRPEIAALPTAAAIQRLTDASASLPAAVPPTTSDIALHTSQNKNSAKNATEISQKATGDRAADVIEAGLHIVFDSVRDGQPPSVAEIDIVAVHGLNFKGSDNHARETWTTGGKLWLKDFLPARLSKPARVMLFAYNSSPAIGAAAIRLDDHAKGLLQWLWLKRKGAEKRPLVFICHSLGGLVVKEALVEATLNEKYKSIVEATCLVAFFATPHQGGNYASVGDVVVKIVTLGKLNNDLLDALKQSSNEATRRFEQARHLFERCLVVSFFEGESYGKMRTIVDKKSATLNLPGSRETQVAMHADHSTICKFDSVDSPACELVLGTVAAEIERALEITQNNYSPDHTTSNEGDLKCLQDLQATDPRDNKKTFEAVSEKLSGEDYTNRIILPPDMKLAESNPPVSTITLCDNLEFEESLEWFTKSPEYRTWSTNEDEASLWLHGRPAEGKTSTAAYVLKSLEKGYHPKGWAVASIFCSSNDSEVGLVTSLAFQLIRRNDDRAQVVQEKMPITNIQKYERIGQEFERNMWQLLETSIMAGTNYETIIMIDGLDTLSVHKRSSFLDNFLKFQKHVQRSTTIRVFISSRTYPDIEEALAHYSSIEKDKERKECLTTLFFQEWNARETRVETFTDGGSWLSSTGAYQKWETDPDQHLLWIEGKPGSGKSTLAKWVVRKIRDERTSSTTSGHSQSGGHVDWKPTVLENEHTIIAEFYYSFRGGCKETSHKLMLQSIVYQIWKQNYKLFPLIQDRYRTMRSKAEILWSYDDLKSALESLHSIDFDLKIIMVVDAIDESDVYNRNDALNFLSLFSSRKSRCNIRLLVASRPEIRPKLSIGKFSHIILQKENKADIRIVANKWIKSFEQSLDCDLLWKVGEYIVENSDGVFLWVTLVLRDLEKYITRGGYREAGLWDRLRRLPRDLGGRDGFYRAMIDSLINGNDQGRDQEDKKEDGQRTLAWTTFPKRPLLLPELREALAVPAQSKSMDPSSYNLARNRPNELDRGILSLCGGLVELRETDSGQIVQLIHQTVREFLLDRKPPPPPPAEPYNLDETQGDFEIANTCCRYLRIAFEASIPLMEADSEFSQVEQLTEHLANHPLLKYAITYFESHLGHSDPQNKFAPIRREFESFLAAVRKTKSYSSLILSRWIRSLKWAPFHLDTDETSATDCLNFMLTWTAGAGKDQALGALLALGANIDCLITLQYGTQISHKSGEATPLMNAARFNRISTVKLLLKAGADMNAADRGGWTPLHRASGSGYVEVVKLLLEKRADVNAVNQGGWMPLHKASKSGYVKVVKLLLEKGANTNTSDFGFLWSPLHRASESGHVEVVKLLLEKGADSFTLLSIR